jgi:hypothetical protein
MVEMVNVYERFILYDLVDCLIDLVREGEAEIAEVMDKDISEILENEGFLAWFDPYPEPWSYFLDAKDFETEEIDHSVKLINMHIFADYSDTDDLDLRSELWIYADQDKSHENVILYLPAHD